MPQDQDIGQTLKDTYNEIGVNFSASR
ncbi:MAG: hypothetical protein ACD_61C00239G0001, partial [uncultured bacterium]